MNSSGKYKLILLTFYFLIVPLYKRLLASSETNVKNITEIIENAIDPVDVIVIDPGHGGKDTGCNSRNLKEKDIVLDLAIKIQLRINEIYPEIEVRITRSDDSFIPLYKRVEIANSPDVDLFISIHCNSLSDSSANGIESYVMGLHTSSENMEIAKRENDVVLLEENYGPNGGFDPYSSEGHIILAMMQQNTLEKSIQLANFTQENLAKNTIFRNRGVKQAGFVVLRKVIVPSILIEAGFISNPKDADLLGSEIEKNKIANSIAESIENYIEFYREQ